jgi:hypothetical protein
MPGVSKEKNPHPLRLRRKHGEGSRPGVTAADGARLVRAQSLRNALVASLVTIITFCLAWIALSAATHRVFAWMTVILGAALGIAIRAAGRGIDWRFPLLAACMALGGAVVSNVVLAASTTASEYGTGTVDILRAVTNMTWPVFFEEVWNVADGFFAVVAAALAAFLAPRKLSRSERFALRLWQEEQSDGHQ